MSEKNKELQVLLVDDNRGDTLLIQEIAKTAAPDMKFIVAHGGEEALDWLKKISKDERPDLILLDLNMPGKDGFSVLAEIRAKDHLKYLPVIILTSSKADVDVKMAYELKANAYLTKPVELGDLGLLLTSIEGFWRYNVTLHSNGQRFDSASV